MDLGTMTKKLKTLVYNSKQEFCNDLELIWNNCLAYNTLPDSIYRTHANLMRSKAITLMKKVPDISIRLMGHEEMEGSHCFKLFA
jgi:transcriptional activator SPT7